MNPKDNFSQHLQSVEDVPELPAKWLIHNWIPQTGITLLVGDGGIGKTNMWCSLLARISCGLSTMLDDPDSAPPIPAHLGTFDPASGRIYDSGLNRSCLFFSKEDSTSKRLRHSLSLYGADMRSISTVDIDHLSGFTFASPDLEKIIDSERPAICVFDPVQAFYPRGASMSSRQQSREVLDRLVSLSGQYNVAFLLICHTNKRKTDDWRQRIAGTGDLPDIARSVIFTSYTEIMPHHAMRFISNEKNSYAPLQDTILYTISEDGLISYAGMSDKKFADFVLSDPYVEKSLLPKTQKELCKEEILSILSSAGQMSVKDLDSLLVESSYSDKTRASAKSELYSEVRVLRTYQDGLWFLSLPPEPAGDADSIPQN